MKYSSGLAQVRLGLAALMLLWMFSSAEAQCQRREVELRDDWTFRRIDGEKDDVAKLVADKSKWQPVSIPHDWAIDGPFDKEIDKQMVAIEQNGEKVPTEKTGRSGSLPWIGKGLYHTTFTVPENCGRAVLNFDGVMSRPVVYVNGKEAGRWMYGYTPFNLDVTALVNKDGRPNTLEVQAENVEQSSRWYPGAGIYRPVTLVTTSSVAVEQWGVALNTISVDTLSRKAFVGIEVKLAGRPEDVKVKCTLLPHCGDDVVAAVEGTPFADGVARLYASVENVSLWSPEKPALYDLKVDVFGADDDALLDTKVITTGIRTVEVSADKGFILNGIRREIKGVCLHHDLGILGAAINKAALARQLKLLKAMGCDAIRTSHNMPSQWQMDLCDSLGLMVMAESFDEWKMAKCKNGYHVFYDEWVERDLRNLVLSNRHHPGVVMWSIGNEIPEQGATVGARMTKRMQDLVHGYDPTRPVTAGMDRITSAIATGYAQVLDVPGMNYRTNLYDEAYKKLSQGFVLGSETASTVSSRGVYKFPVTRYKSKMYDDGQCSSYDLEACSWSNIPDDDWQMQEDRPWLIGEFVWTGFDYLGEPTPYDVYWPSRSSYFGILDLAGLPKDRYFLYRSHWNKTAHTVHLLPHWNWNGMEGKDVPVYCYTDCDEAELFLNGKSLGRRAKDKSVLSDRFRLHWDSVKYEPGELKVVAYGGDGAIIAEDVVRTSGEPYAIKLVADRGTGSALRDYGQMEPNTNPALFEQGGYLDADGRDMAFVTAVVVDKDGNPCPTADNRLSVNVSGYGSFKGICNGDATSLEVFTRPAMKTFNGQLVIGVKTSTKAGEIKVKVSGNGLRKGEVKLISR